MIFVVAVLLVDVVAALRAMTARAVPGGAALWCTPGSARGRLSVHIGRDRPAALREDALAIGGAIPVMAMQP